MAEKIALFVGINEFDDYENRNLKYDNRDVSALAGFLRHKCFFNNVECLLNSDGYQIVETVENLVNHLHHGDFFLFYFAGCGHLVDEKLLLTLDTESVFHEYERKFLSLGRLIDATEEPGIDRVFILDMCCTSLLTEGYRTSTGLQDNSYFRNIVEESRLDSGSFSIMGSLIKDNQLCDFSNGTNSPFAASMLDVLESSDEANVEVLVDENMITRLRAGLEQIALSKGCFTENLLQFARKGFPPVLLEGAKKSFLLVDSSEKRIPPLPEEPSHIKLLSSRIPRLEITTIPSGATIYLNGKESGSTPISLVCPSGSYTVLVEKRGYFSQERTIESGNDASLEIRLHERPLPKSSPVFPLISYSNGRFVKNLKTGQVEDLQTGLEWFVGPDRRTSHYEAGDWVNALGGSWHLPSKKELKELINAGIGCGESPETTHWGPFDNSGWFVWAKEIDSNYSFMASCIFFTESRDETEIVFMRGDSNYYGRVFAVREKSMSADPPFMPSLRKSYNEGLFMQDVRTGVIEDMQTGMRWLVGPDTDMSKNEATKWVTGNWRFPSVKELAELNKTGIMEESWGPFENSGYGVLTRDTGAKDSSLECYFSFGSTSNMADKPSEYRLPEPRVFAVCTGEMPKEHQSTPPAIKSYRNGRFLKNLETDVITDTKAFLEWLVGPDKSTAHADAVYWVNSLGSSWRFPTLNEFKELYNAGIGYTGWDIECNCLLDSHLGPFENSGEFVWMKHSSSYFKADCFIFTDGGISSAMFDNIGLKGRVFAVRYKR